MVTSVKKFVTGGTSPKEGHREVYQIRDNGSAVTKRPASVIADDVFENVSGIPGVDVSRSQILDVAMGREKELIFHPDVYSEDYETFPCGVVTTNVGNSEIKTYENVLRIYGVSGGGVTAAMSAEYGRVRFNESYVPVSIKEEDVCFVPVGSTWRESFLGDTIVTAVHAPFATEEEANSYLRETKKCIGERFSHYDVEAFSRSHLEQVSWYLDSKRLFPFYEKLRQERERSEESQDLSEDAPCHDF